MRTKQRIRKESLILIGAVVAAPVLIFVVGLILITFGNSTTFADLIRDYPRALGKLWFPAAVIGYGVFQFMRLTSWAIKTVRSKEA